MGGVSRIEMRRMPRLGLSHRLSWDHIGEIWIEDGLLPAVPNAATYKVSM